MTALARIVAVGASIARLRLARAAIADAVGWLAAPAAAPPAGARSICNWDEDALTLAVDAGRHALRTAGAARGQPDALHLASTTLPFADRSNATLAATCLDLSNEVETLEFGGSLRAGTGALINAARRGGRTLVIGSDARLARPGSTQEQRFGHGAAALIVEGARPGGSTTGDGPDTVEARTPAEPALADVVGLAHVSADFVDHYRMSGSAFDYVLEERWFRDAALAHLPSQAIDAALRVAGLGRGDVGTFVLAAPAASVRRVAAAAGLVNARVADALDADCGDTGVAHPLLMLIAALERARAADVLLLLGLGQGVDALVLRASGSASGGGAPRGGVGDALARRRDEPRYVRYLAHAGLLDVDYGMRAERDNRTAHSVAWRKQAMVGAFRGGRCSHCGTVQFPLSRVCVDPACRRTDTQASFRLADETGVVRTFTEDWQACSPRPPAIYGNVNFASGGNLLMELTDLEPGELTVGDTVRFVLRVKDVDAQRRFRRYFWKAVRS